VDRWTATDIAGNLRAGRTESEARHFVYFAMRRSGWNGSGIVCGGNLVLLGAAHLKVWPPPGNLDCLTCRRGHQSESLGKGVAWQLVAGLSGNWAAGLSHQPNAHTGTMDYSPSTPLQECRPTRRLAQLSQLTDYPNRLRSVQQLQQLSTTQQELTYHF
jgi:hypothetical protein